MVEGVSKTFVGSSGPPVLAIEHADLTIAENEFVTLVGRSGCGKSTLLRLLAGLVPCTTGRITMGDRLVEGPGRDVGLMFQRPALMPWRTVIDNVLLPADFLGLDRRATRVEAERLLALVGLEGFEARRPWELSGGMQQRVALCRSLVYRPRVLLMDEPFAALDALTREEMSLELQRIWIEHRTTIVFVTHSISEAVTLSDRVVVMTPRPGRIARVIDVPVPRPRSFASGDDTEVITRANDAVRRLLYAPREEIGSVG